MKGRIALLVTLAALFVLGCMNGCCSQGACRPAGGDTSDLVSPQASFRLPVERSPINHVRPPDNGGVLLLDEWGDPCFARGPCVYRCPVTGELKELAEGSEAAWVEVDMEIDWLPGVHQLF